MFKIFKELKDYKANKKEFNSFQLRKAEIDEFKEKQMEFTAFKLAESDIAKYYENEHEFKEFLDKYDRFQEFLKYGEAFEMYRDALGRDNRPFFLMYASDVDDEGNVAFSYDFSPIFVDMLRKQGIQGIDDLEIVEAYLHYIFSQNYFAEMFRKEREKDQ